MAYEMNCQSIADEEVIERYVAGRLPAEVAEAFEAHYLTCEKCQAAIKLAAGIRAAGSRAAKPPRRLGIWIAAALAAAAGIALIVTRQSGIDPRLSRLGGVGQPPIYLGVPVRSEIGQADSLFERAMKSYSRRMYREAAEELRAALKAGADSTPTVFFLGASLLLSDQPVDAASVLEAVIKRGPTPYTEEARLLYAKALLRLGRAEEATRVLENVKGPDKPLSTHARALADSIAEFTRY